MPKKRTVQPYYTKPMQRLEHALRNLPDVRHAVAAAQAIEETRQARMARAA